MKKYRGYIIFSGICLALSVFFGFILVGYRFLGLCFFALAALGGVFAALKAAEKRRPGAAAGLRCAVWAVLAAVFIAVAVTEVFIISEARSDDGSGEAAIVLGAGVHGATPSRSLRARLEEALEFAEEKPGAILVLSGGQGTGEDVTEARCMYDWLTARGVAPERLILEERASSTLENLEFSRALLKSEGYDGTVCVITANYHIARAKMMARDAGFTGITARGRGTGMPILELNYYLREAPAIWWYLLRG